MKKYTIFITTISLITFFSVFSEASTYNMTGVWKYTTSNSTSWGGCDPIKNRTSVAYVVQSGDLISLFGEGRDFTGNVDGKTYSLYYDNSTYSYLNYIWIDFELTGPKNGTGILTWYYSENNDECGGQAKIDLYKLDVAPSFNASGIWSFQTSNHWAEIGCQPDNDESGYLFIDQNGDTFTYWDQFGVHTGRINGQEYHSVIFYTEDNGTTIQTISVQLNQSGSGFGKIVWYWTDGYSYCSGGSDIQLTKQVTPPSGDITGKWQYQSPYEQGETTITQHGTSFSFSRRGIIQSGVISGNKYICYATYPEAGGFAFESIAITLNNQQNEGSGFVRYYWTNGTNYSVDTFPLTINKLTGVTSPDQPILLYPGNGAVNQPLILQLKTGSFSDTGPGDFHYQTGWQISLTDDFSNLVMNKMSGVFLTQLKVPHNILKEGCTYYWRARFYDQDNTASAWSSVFSFTTSNLNKDVNQNGIPDDQEQDDLDMNNDGILDSQQNFIKSLKVQDKGSIGVSRSHDSKVSNINAIESIDPGTISSIFRPHNMPLDMLVMDLSVIKPIDDCKVKIHLSNDVTAGAKWLMYNTVNGWRDYTDQVTFSGRTAVIKLKDWVQGDSDGIPNGNVIDPGGYCFTPVIKGTIIDASSNQPILHGTISIGTEIIPATTNGLFFSPIIQGTFEVTASATGYVSEKKTLSFDDPAAVVTQDFRLEPIPDVGLGDAIAILQVLAGFTPNTLPAVNDFNQDSKTGLADAIYILQKAADIR